MRDGDPHHVDWFPNTTELADMSTGLDYEVPITVVIWSRYTNNDGPIHQIYNAVKDLKELSYATVRSHPNGLTSVEFVLSDFMEDCHNGTFIFDNIDKL